MPELELKFAAAPADLPLVKRKLLKLAGRERATRTTLTSVYYDTSDRRLKRLGLSLRVRRGNHRFVQTVKAEDAKDAPPLTRGEWEDAVSGVLPDLHAPNSGPHLPLTLSAAELHPVFSTVIRRAVIPINLDGTTEIDAAVDEGEIQTAAGLHGEPICELELEYKLGNPAAIYDIGLRLLEAAPLYIETRSKAERGFDLLDPGLPKHRIVHASPIVLEPEMTVEAVLQKFGCECLALVLRNEAAALSGVAEALHQMRVALRRLRAVLSTVKRMLPAEQYRWVGDELRWMAGTLGPVRNWDVIADGILASVTGTLLAPQDRDALTRACEAERLRARQEAALAIRSVRYTTGLLKLLRWFTAREWRDQPVSEQSALLVAPIGTVAQRLIAQRHRQTRRASKGFAEFDSEQRHQVRITIKKLRYTIDLLQSLFPAAGVSRFVKLLKPLQEELGQANDVRVARDLIGGLRISDIDRAAGIVLGWHQRGLADHEKKLVEDLRKVRNARPFW
jgi:inorganic triphosphatase YgiF